MKSFLRVLFQVIIWILLLEVLKVILKLQKVPQLVLPEMIIICAQMFIFLGFCYLIIYYSICRNFILNSKKKLLFGLASFLVFISLFEVSSVFLLNHPSKIPTFFRTAFADYYQQYDRSIITYDRDKARYDSGFFYMLKPDTTITFQGREFWSIIHTNSKGLRDDETSLVKPEIICLGDSYTFGWGIDNGISFPDKLEKLTGFKVLNTGVVSFGTARELKLFDQLDTTNLKYLIIQYCDNDVPENREYLKNNYNLRISPKSTYDSAISKQVFNQKYFPGKIFLLTAVQFFKQPYRLLKRNIKSESSNKADEARLFLNLLLHSKINFKKVDVIVIYITSFDLLSDPFMKELKKIKQESPYDETIGNNLKLIDLSCVLLKEDYYILDIHLKPSGHEKVANTLLEFIEIKH